VIFEIDTFEYRGYNNYIMINRAAIINAIQAGLERSRVVALIGPRQCGKTTLARKFVPVDSLNYFDLEDPTSLMRLEEPMTALRDLSGIVVIDEIQRKPELFPILRVLSDRNPLPAKFLILGSASPDLIRDSSESLAGRIETIAISGFSLAELGAGAQEQHLLRGGFPLSYLAETDQHSLIWRKNFVQTFLERDLPQLGVRIPSTTMLRFWIMIAHYHGQIWKASEPARSLGSSEPTIRRYIDLLEGLFLVRLLQPWHTNIKKRQVKSPKVYVRDSGLLHYLLGISTQTELGTHPKLGASWEGYALEEVIKAVEPEQAYFWATHSGAELDLLLIKDGRHYGVECKRVDAPRVTASMRTALDDLKLEHIAVVYPGKIRYPLEERVTAVPLQDLARPDLNKLF
jgi:uncharacterized protein